MNLEKYQHALFKNMKAQLVSWFEEERGNEIPSEEVYRFLHSIKGTAGTLELEKLALTAGSLMDKIEGRKKSWTTNELREFLFELLGRTYETEYSVEEDLEPVLQKENIPLVYLIDNDISMLMLLKDEMEKKGWMVIANSDPGKAMAQFYDFNPDCLIVNIQLPEKDGFQILKDIREQNGKYFLPKMMLSSENTKENRIKALMLGADDFISKPLDLEEFLLRVERQIGKKQMFDQMVLVDELTQVYNRRFLTKILARSLAELKRTSESFTVAIVDLDYFKRINDSYGHLAGDKVLEEFAFFLKRSVRASDIVTRYGGEEFIIVFPHSTSREIKTRLENVLHDFSRKTFHSGEEGYTVSFSAGVYTVSDHSLEEKSILQHADSALYEAKKNGRARIEVSENGRQELPKKRLLVSIIDDDAIIRTMLVKMMEAADFPNYEADIESFEDGLKFISSSRLKQEGHHFLILDGMMPSMDGLEVIQEVKKERVIGRLTVLMLTGRKSETDIARALKLGADDYVTKPFSITELQARIERLLKRMD
ncbi:GGDEF domain-containing response regulator [Peribacillus kribbensis]|uniref:GGDEF domain-containing response regulator n=1 Tax=Peribacillus kribbensis TaxID=356658 RepID=UPI001FE02BFF|nr:diguanylate cyclase [Peribacillus kribbensis]